MNAFPDSRGSLRHNLLLSGLLLSLSTAGAWLATQSGQISGAHGVPMSLLFVLLIHPFALAAWFFCGLPGLGLAIQSVAQAVQEHRWAGGVAGTLLVVLSLAGGILCF